MSPSKMSRLSVIFSSAGFALSATPSNFPSPLTYDARGYLISTANVFISSPSSTRVPFKLTSGPLVIVGANVEDESIHTDISFDMVDNIYRVYPLHVESVGYHGSASSSYLGIGPASPLTQQAGSVAVIRRNDTTAELSIGATREYFNTTCDPGTLMTLDASATGELGVEITIDGDGIWSNGFSSHRLVFGGTGMHSTRATIPRALFDRIQEYLVERGITQGPSNPRELQGCTASAIDTLPAIHFEFSTGSIVYFPEDYVDFNPEDTSCQLLIGAASAGQPLAVEPLRLVGQNFRVTRDNVWDICDSAADETL
jgi:hypothetical protein